jgi:hypothetical protein
MRSQRHAPLDPATSHLSGQPSQLKAQCFDQHSRAIPTPPRAQVEKAATLPIYHDYFQSAMSLIFFEVKNTRTGPRTWFTNTQ